MESARKTATNKAESTGGAPVSPGNRLLPRLYKTAAAPHEIDTAAIERSPTRLLLLPSYLCLDAPLVALGWALALDADSPAGESGWARPAALFCCVWMVYLADRLHDASGPPPDADTPPRHRFAARHRGLLLAILLAVGTGAALFVLPALERREFLAGFAVAGGTAFYFLAFRIVRRVIPDRGAPDPVASDENPGSLVPWKESTIALCFAAGVFVAAGVVPGTPSTIVEAIALFLLFLANCLFISAAEAEHDATRDRTAFFAGDRSGGLLTLPALILAVVLAGVLIWPFAGVDRVSVSLAVSGLALLGGLPLARRRPHSAQPFADAVLLAPWAILLLAWLLGGRRV